MGDNERYERMDTIQLICGTRTFAVSSELISAKSDYFKAMLDSGMQETVTSKVVLPNFDEKVVEFVLSFVERNVVNDFDTDLVEQILEVRQLNTNVL